MTVLVFPGVPKACERKGLTVPKLKGVRLLRRLPFFHPPETSYPRTRSLQKSLRRSPGSRLRLDAKDVGIAVRELKNYVNFELR